MGWGLEIEGVNVPAKAWSGPQGPLGMRSGFRGPTAGSRECGAANFSMFHRVAKRPPSWALHLDGVDDVAAISWELLPIFPAQMTVCFWGRRNPGTPGIAKFILAHSCKDLGVERSSWQIQDNNILDKLTFEQSTNGSSFQTSVLSGAIADSTWYCLIARNDGVNAQWYVDLIASGSPDTSPATVDLEPEGPEGFVQLSIGAKYNRDIPAYENFAHWDLDDVRIFGRALTDGEMAAYYNGGRGLYNALGGELIWLRCDEGSGSQLVDASGNARHAQVTGANWIASTIAQGPEENLLKRGSLVVISKNGQRRFRGKISEVQTPKWKTEIQTVEAAAALNELEAGMNSFGGMDNPELRMLWREGRYFEGWRPSALPGIGQRLAYSDEYVFDSYQWTNYNAAEGQRFRTMIWREEALETILARLRALVDLGDAGLMASVATATAGPSKASLLPIQDKDGNPVEPVWIYQRTSIPVPGEDPEFEFWYPQPWGLITRSLAGGSGTFYWRYKEGNLELYQLVNHRRAEMLGIRRLDWILYRGDNDPLEGAPTTAVQYTDPTIPVSRTLGPFDVSAEELGEHMLCFGTWGYSEEHSQQTPPRFLGNRHIGRVWKIDLRQRKQYGEGRELDVTVEELNLLSDTIYNYVAYNPSSGLFEFTNTPHSLWKHESKRTGGKYTDRGEQHTIWWQGNLWLEEMAVDARGQTIGGILRELSLLNGCEWWIDGAGVLRMERMDAAPRTASISAVKILNDVSIERAPGEPMEDFQPAAVPMDEYQAALIEAGVNELAAIAGSNARRIQVESDENQALELSLGARLTVNGVPAGRIVAVEGDRFTETIELEPLPDEPARAIA